MTNSTIDEHILEHDLKSIFDLYYKVPKFQDIIERLLPQIIIINKTFVSHFIVDFIKKDNLKFAQNILETYDKIFKDGCLLWMNTIEFDDEYMLEGYMEIINTVYYFNIMLVFERKLEPTKEEYEFRSKNILYPRWLKLFELMITISIKKKISGYFLNKLIKLWENHKRIIIENTDCYKIEISRIDEILNNRLSDDNISEISDNESITDAIDYEMPNDKLIDGVINNDK